MNLLLDTHALIWFLDDDPRLSAAAREAIANGSNSSHVSDVTAWEICIKHSLGKLGLPMPFADLFPGHLVSLGFHPLPIRPGHLHQLAHQPWHHRDPFDRLLVSQAICEGMTLVGCDENISKYPVRLLW